MGEINFSFIKARGGRNTRYFNRRVTQRKGKFSRAFIAYSPDAALGKIWQRNYWENIIRDVRAFERAELERRYGREAIVALTGPRGTSFIADTYGIHAGPVPLSRPRLMLEIGYSILPVYSLSYRPQRIAQAYGLNRYVNRLLVH